MAEKHMEDHQVVHRSFTPAEMTQGKMCYNYEIDEYPTNAAHGISLFDKGETLGVLHTYSSHARGPEILLSTCRFLTPKGRDKANLHLSVATIRHQDRYYEKAIDLAG